MICTKCNNEIPEGAKFCPSCGAAAAAPEIEKKFYCEKCGLELLKGAKFCSVCGGNGVARENKPAEVMAAVDLGKPSESDSLVSAMNSANTASAPVSGVPMPSNNIPMPVNGNSGIAASSGSYSNSEPVIPSYVASVSADAGQAPVMPMPTASGEAAAAVKKKGNGGKIALFSILGVLLIAIAVTLVMFFTNRAAFLSTLMGKEKYATMVEGNSIKNVTDKLDIPSISNGIKTASGTVQSLYAAYGAEMLDDMTGISGMTKDIAPMSYTSDGSYTAGGFDLESFSKEFAALLIDTYGVNSISETLTMNVELSDSVKSMIQSASFSEVKIDEMLDLVNGTSLNYTLTAKDSQAAVTMGTQGKIVVNAKLMLDGQDAYISLPFASDKALKITVPKGNSNDQLKLDVTPLELDEKELERLITECVEIYLDYYKQSAIEMDNGKLKAGSVTAEGKVITAEFKGEQLSKMFTDIAKHIVKDDYLMTAIADYANSLGAETTKQELIDEALEEIENTMDADDDDKLIITTVIDNNGNVLGKAFKAIDEDDVLCEITYAESDNKLGFEFNGSDYSSEISNMQVTIDKKDDENGTCKVKLTVDENEFSLIINYSDCKTAEFCGKQIPTGKISVGMALPEDFADQLGKENFAAVNGAKLNIAITADSANTVSYSIGVDVPNYGSISFKDVVTAMNDDSDLKIPSNVIDITDVVINDMLPGDDTYDQLMTFAGEVIEALKKSLPEFIVDELDYYLLPGGTIGGVFEEDIEYLLEDIMSDMALINTAINNETADDAARSKLQSLAADYVTLYKEVLAKKSDMTASEFTKYENEYYDLYGKLIDLNKVSSINIGGIVSLAERVEAKMEKIGEKFAEIYNKYGSASGNVVAQSDFSDIMKTFQELSTYCIGIGVDDISECTEEQIKHIDSLLDALDSKIAKFEAQSSN